MHGSSGLGYVTAVRLSARPNFQEYGVVEMDVNLEKQINDPLNSCWAANQSQPFDRDVQILLMKSHKERHDRLVKKIQENQMF